MSRRVLIFVAIRMEARVLADALHLRFDRDGFRATGTFKPGLELELRLAGIGAVALPGSFEAPIPDLIISAGLAGALSPALRCGEVVVDQIHTSQTPVLTADQKSELFTHTSALAVDMETAHILALAERATVPFTAIRAISDTAADSIDPRVIKLVDPFGKPQGRAIFSTLPRHPALIPQLVRLRRNSMFALEKLAEHLKGFLNAM